MVSIIEEEEIESIIKADMGEKARRSSRAFRRKKAQGISPYIGRLVDHAKFGRGAFMGYGEGIVDVEGDIVPKLRIKFLDQERIIDAHHRFLKWAPKPPASAPIAPITVKRAGAGLASKVAQGPI